MIEYEYLSKATPSRPNYRNLRQLHLSASKSRKAPSLHLCTRKILLEWISSQQLTSSPMTLHEPSSFHRAQSSTTILIHARTKDDRSASIPPVPSTPVSLSMKLPRLLVLFCLLPNRPPLDFFLPPELDVAPPTQRKTVARNRHATAAHMKPKLYFPMFADVPADLNALRPCTNAALSSVSISLVTGTTA